MFFHFIILATYNKLFVGGSCVNSARALAGTARRGLDHESLCCSGSGSGAASRHRISARDAAGVLFCEAPISRVRVRCRRMSK